MFLERQYDFEFNIIIRFCQYKLVSSHRTCNLRDPEALKLGEIHGLSVSPRTARGSDGNTSRSREVSKKRVPARTSLHLVPPARPPTPEERDPSRRRDLNRDGIGDPLRREQRADQFGTPAEG